MLGGVAKAIDQSTGEDFNEFLYDLAALPPAEIPYGPSTMSMAPPSARAERSAGSDESLRATAASPKRK